MRLFEVLNPELLAPNGHKSNLNKIQYHQVRSENFKRWFGDWEHNPNNASKVVDENGEPLVCYHATGHKFSEFDSNKTQDSLFWFTHDFHNIGNVGAASIKHVMPVFLNIRHLAGWDEYDNLNIDQIISKGFDGIKLDDDFVAFYPAQIKSAISNIGTYGPSHNIKD
jgi:hypothetical protein